MVIDFLNRDAVDRNLLRIGREGMQGRKLIGVKFDRRSNTWFLVTKNGLCPIVTVSADRAPPAARPKARSKRARPTRRKKK